MAGVSSLLSGKLPTLSAERTCSFTSTEQQQKQGWREITIMDARNVIELIILILQVIIYILGM